MQGLRVEGMAFLTALLTGMTAACAYLCIRKLRRVIRHSRAAVTAEDGLYWIAASLYVFVQMYHTSSGSIRWYFIIGAGLGILLFFLSGRLIGKMISERRKKRRKKS